MDEKKDDKNKEFDREAIPPHLDESNAHYEKVEGLDKKGAEKRQGEEILKIDEKIKKKKARRERVKNGFGKICDGASRGVSKIGPFLKKNPRVAAGIVGSVLIYLGATQGWKALTYSIKKVSDAGGRYIINVFNEEGSSKEKGEITENKSLETKADSSVHSLAPISVSKKRVKLPYTGILERDLGDKSKEYIYTYDERDGRGILILEQEDKGAKYTFIGRDNYNGGGLTLDKLIVEKNDGKKEYSISYKELTNSKKDSQDIVLFLKATDVFNDVREHLAK